MTIFDIAKEAINDLKPEFKIKLENDSQLEEIIRFIKYDSPLFFHVKDFKCCYQNKEAIFKMRYKIPHNSYQALLSLVNKKLDEIVLGMKDIDNDFDKEVYIHDYIFKRVKYKFRDGDLEYNVLGPLLYGEGICAGIALLAKALFDKVGIESHYVIGTVKDKDSSNNLHAWNIVKINNGWYHLDITLDKTTVNKSRYVRYDAFNVTTKQLAIYEEVKDNFKDLADKCCYQKDNYYHHNHLCFNDAKEANKYIEECLKHKQKAIHFIYNKDSCQKYINRMTDIIIYRFDNVLQVHDRSLTAWHLVYIEVKYLY